MRSPTERGGILGSILLVLGVLVLIAMIAVVAGGLYIARHVHVTASEGRHGETVAVETPFGSLRVRENAGLDPRRMGVPVYPGAVLRQDHHQLASVELNFGSDNKDVVVVAGEYTTPDSIEKVREFYRAELPHWMISEDRRRGIQFSFTEGGHQKIVILKERGGVTVIGLASVGVPPSN